MVAKSRILWIRPLVPTVLCTNGWFSRRVASLNFTLTQHFPSCERMQQENRIHTMGSLPPFDRSQHSWVWPLDERQLSRGFLWDRANAEKFRFPSILLKNSEICTPWFFGESPSCKEVRWDRSWGKVSWHMSGNMPVWPPLATKNSSACAVNKFVIPSQKRSFSTQSALHCRKGPKYNFSQATIQNA